MAHKTILLKGEPCRKELLAGEVIKAGALIERQSDGKVWLNSAADGAAAKLFAVEEDFVGDGIDVSYSTGDTVQFVAARQGDEIQAWLASGQTVAIGDFLSSAANGNLKFASTAVLPNSIIGYALEAVTAAADVRIKIEVA